MDRCWIPGLPIWQPASLQKGTPARTGSQYSSFWHPWPAIAVARGTKCHQEAPKASKLESEGIWSCLRASQNDLEGSQSEANRSQQAQQASTASKPSKQAQQASTASKHSKQAQQASKQANKQHSTAQHKQHSCCRCLKTQQTRRSPSYTAGNQQAIGNMVTKTCFCLLLHFVFYEGRYFRVEAA